ncbi:hypothetical protein [Chitinophaga sp. RAB17]|uniref:hypothetical protein n=1 Tax=Chitinophaga sp. RAB17 TaxID=3233049 RepID=UPI003F916840
MYFIQVTKYESGDVVELNINHIVLYRNSVDTEDAVIIETTQSKVLVRESMERIGVLIKNARDK